MCSLGVFLDVTPTFIIFKIRERKTTMFPYTSLQSVFPKLAQNSSGSYLLVDSALFQALTSNIEQMRHRQQNLAREVKDLKQEYEDLRITFSQNLEAMVKECLTQQMNAKKESQHFSFCIKSQICPVKGCKRRYSSKTALMAHHRSKHETSDYYD